jgi:hypothetical protein
MVTSLPIRDGVCVIYVLDKHNQDNFDKHASTPLQLVHSDLCGLLPSPSFYGFNYFLTFIDYFSICTCIYFLKLKSEFFDLFFSYKALAEKQFGH